jgi:hypothetical protein
MIFAAAANVIPFLVPAAPAAPKGLAHTAIIHLTFWGDRPFIGKPPALGQWPLLGSGRLTREADPTA